MFNQYILFHLQIFAPKHQLSPFHLMTRQTKNHRPQKVDDHPTEVGSLINITRTFYRRFNYSDLFIREGAKIMGTCAGQTEFFRLEKSLCPFIFSQEKSPRPVIFFFKKSVYPVILTVKKSLCPFI